MNPTELYQTVAPYLAVVLVSVALILIALEFGIVIASLFLLVGAYLLS